MLSLEHINLRRGPELLLEDASFVLHKGTRVGVVGRNGSGKSSRGGTEMLDGQRHQQGVLLRTTHKIIVCGIANRGPCHG